VNIISLLYMICRSVSVKHCDYVMLRNKKCAESTKNCREFQSEHDGRGTVSKKGGIVIQK